ncbi:glycoside hydrolase family protein [Curtobacterium sp. 24E2]
MRTFASLDGYLATATDGGLQIHQYATAELGPVSVETGYPHDGRVVVTVTEDGPLALGLRIPVWSDTTTVQGPDGAAHPEPGTLHVVDRHWTAGDTVELVFDTTPHRYVADTRIDAARGQVAIERGPLVYAVEQADQQGFTVDDLTVDAVAPITEERRDDLLDGIVTLRVPGHAPAGHEQAPWPYQRMDANRSGPTRAGSDASRSLRSDVAAEHVGRNGSRRGRDQRRRRGRLAGRHHGPPVGHRDSGSLLRLGEPGRGADARVAPAGAVT